MSLHSKKDLEIILSKLKTFHTQSLSLEQYPTPSNIAAAWVWTMFMNGEVQNKTILDAGCGPGIIGLGLLMVGAKKVIFVDKDKTALSIAQENYERLVEEYNLGAAEFINSDIQKHTKKVNIVVQNPPFGTKNQHADKAFLEVAFKTAPILYSMHKTSTITFVTAIAKDHHFIITAATKFVFPIKATHHFHTKPVRNIDVTLYRMEKIKL